MIRSPSGDIDILTLFVANDFGGVKVLIDNGTGKHRKTIDATSSTLDAEEKKAVVGLHAFSGNDYVSSFFRKGKKAFWKVMQKDQKYIRLFAELGNYSEVPVHVSNGLEEFVCDLYGHARISSVNKLRHKIFWQKLEKENKVIDLSFMPPCEANLKLHIMRANYVASIFRKADRLILDLEDHTSHGWSDRGQVIWSNDCYPKDITELLLTEEEVENVSSSVYESDSEELEFDDAFWEDD